MNYKKTVLVTILSLLGVSTYAASLEEKPKIQIAIALDASNSMDGLLHQAKTQLWRIVNELKYASKFGNQPTLEVALYEYGKTTLPAAEGFLRQIRPMSRDLDLLSENLFSLSTRGGEEYAGWVIRNATQDLVWDTRPESFRAIYIAGNESFDQGPVSFRDAISEARKQDIVVNTIYAGHRESGVLEHWDEGAIIGLGAFMNIDPNHRRRIIPTPYDDDVKRINSEINDTYIPMNTASSQREQFIDTNQPADQVDTLDKVLIESLHEQLKSRGFSIEKK